MSNGSLALVAGLVLGRQRQRHVGAGIGILAQVLDGLADAVTGADVRQHQRELRCRNTQIKDGKFIVIRHKFPQMKVLYDPEKRMGSVIEKEANVPEAKIQRAFFEALAWAKKK